MPDAPLPPPNSGLPNPVASPKPTGAMPTPPSAKPTATAALPSAKPVPRLEDHKMSSGTAMPGRPSLGTQANPSGNSQKPISQGAPLPKPVFAAQKVGTPAPVGSSSVGPKPPQQAMPSTPPSMGARSPISAYKPPMSKPPMPPMPKSSAPGGAVPSMNKSGAPGQSTQPGVAPTAPTSPATPPILTPGPKPPQTAPMSQPAAMPKPQMPSSSTAVPQAPKPGMPPMPQSGPATTTPKPSPVAPATKSVPPAPTGAGVAPKAVPGANPVAGKPVSNATIPQVGLPPRPGAPATPGLPPTPGIPPKPGIPPTPGIPPKPQAGPTAAIPGAPAIPTAAVNPAMAKPTPGVIPPASTIPAAAPASATPASTPTAPAPTATPPKQAQASGGFRRFLPFIGIGVIILAVVGFALSWWMNQSSTTSVSTSTTPKNSSTKTASPTPAAAKEVTLTYWGLWEPSDTMMAIFKEFEQANPGVKVEYVKQSHKDYRERLQTAIASGSGPDIFRFHASWTPMLKSELSTIPSTVMSTSEYQQTFYPVAAEQLQVGGQFVGIPLMYDGLGLYYNKEILRTAGAEPPTTWAALRTLASQLTVRSGATIQRGGLAIGNATNVEHFADILGLLMLQNGADPTKPTSAEARDALLFYTNFVKADKVWDESLPSSTVAFARGEAAMMFAPSWRAHEILELNPSLSFAIAPVPKLSDAKLGWASYWAEGVSAQSKNKDASWKLLKYLSTAEVMKKMYSEQSKLRTFGEPYSRVDLAGQLASDPYVGAYMSDAPSAKAWYLSSFTHDNGLNDQMIKYYADAITAVLSGKTVDESLKTVDQGSAQVLRQYGVTTTAR